MFKQLESKFVGFSLDESFYRISIKNILICAVIYGLATVLMSVVFSMFLSGLFTIVNIITSPLLVGYLIIELKDSIFPAFINHFCEMHDKDTFLDIHAS